MLTNTYCRVELFGRLRIVCQDDTLSPRFHLQKSASLLAYLAFHSDRPHPRERLVDLFWPELSNGRNSLSTTLSHLRRELERLGVPVASMLITDRQWIGLNAETITTDVAEFNALLTQASQSADIPRRAELLAKAVALYRGDLLEDSYEEWSLTAQTAYRERYCEALIQWAWDLKRQQAFAASRKAAERAMELDPLREAAVLILIRVLARQGRTASALETFRVFQTRLRDELNAEPSLELCQLMEQLLRDPYALHVPLVGQSVSMEMSMDKGEGAPATPALSAPAARIPQSAEPPLAPIVPIDPAAIEAKNVPVENAAFDQKDTQSDAQRTKTQRDIAPEAVGGAVPLDSPYYIVRAVDALFETALKRQDSIVLVKGPGQVGKTSLLARGMQQAREDGAVVFLTDLQQFGESCWQTAEHFYQALIQNIADQLDQKLDLQLDFNGASAHFWSATRSANANFNRFFRREVLEKLPNHVVWGLDEVDRLFATPYHNDVFALFRSWHNGRALDPGGPWRGLTLAIAYATEAHLFITDLNQSPFNVGTRLTLEDFTPEEVAELNRRYHSPLNANDLKRFYSLVGGNPYLVRRGLQELVLHPADIETFTAQADRSEGCYGDHLNRMRVNLTRDAALYTSVRDLAQSRKEMSQESFYRLRSAGIVIGSAESGAEFRCSLYRSYLGRHL